MESSKSRQVCFSRTSTLKNIFLNLRNNNLLDKDLREYEKLINNGLDEQQALKKIQIKTLLRSDDKDYTFLREILHNIGMVVFKNFLLWWCNKKDVVSIIDAMQKLIQLHHNKKTDG